MCRTTVIPKEDVLSDRLFQATIHALELFSIHVGNQLGLYSTIRHLGSVDAPVLARDPGLAGRYAREWLEHQAVAGFLTADSGESDISRRYRLPDSHALVLCEEGHSAHMAPLAQMVAGIGGVLPEVIAAYRSGSG